jgi:hypothetical protein
MKKNNMKFILDICTDFLNKYPLRSNEFELLKYNNHFFSNRKLILAKNLSLILFGLSLLLLLILSVSYNYNYNYSEGSDTPMLSLNLLA